MKNAVGESTSSPTDATPDARVLAIVRQLALETHPDLRCQVAFESTFDRDLGLDSLARVELMLRIGKAFGVELPEEALSHANTPQDVLHYIGRIPRQTVAAPATALQGAHAVGLPGGAQTLVQALEWQVERQPDRVHILLHDEQHGALPIRYRDLLDAARGIASGLIASGLQPRQTVALMLPTGRDYLACFFGVMIAGGVPVPIYPPARPAQIEDHLRRHAGILSNAEATFIITVTQAKPVAVMLQAAVPSLTAIVTPADLAAAPPTSSHYRPRQDDIAFLQYTSGSTGDPKGVVLTHANLLANVRALGKAAQASSEDVFVSWLPLYHDMGLIGAWFGSLYHGIPLVLMSPLAFLAQPVRWLQAISRHHGTISAAPNFAYELCVRHIGDADMAELDLSSWRLAFNGAEPVSPATLESFAHRFAACGFRREAITPVYGLAESSVGLAFPPLRRGPRIDRIERSPFSTEGKAVPASDAQADALSIPACGRPLPGHEIRIVDEAGYELPERRIGLLEFRGPSATSGYYRNPEATAKLFHHGWLDSGDHAYMADGEVFVTGRVKDLIKRGGRNLYPYDLEQAVGDLPGIRRGCVAVFAMPGDTGTERLVVMAETREDDETARTDLRRKINQAAVDVIGTPVDEIVLAPPHSVLKTSSGKIRRIASREAYEHGRIKAHDVAPRWHRARLIAKMALAQVTVHTRRIGDWIYGGYAWSVFGVLAMCCGATAILLQRPAQARRIARFGARMLCRLTGLPLTAEGLERLPAGPHVLLVNHTSYVDAIVLTALLPSRPGYAFTAKQEFAGQPLIGTLLRSLGTLFIERFDIGQSTANVELMSAALRHGDSLVVFPEGTFSREPGLKPFHAGAFMAAARANVPAAVAGVRGARAVLRAGSWLPHRAPVVLEIGPVLMPSASDWSSVARLSATARKAMVPLSGEFDLSE